MSTTALTPTQQEIRTLTPRALAMTAQRAVDFNGFTPREMEIYLKGVEDGMEAKASACHSAMAQFLDAFHPENRTIIPVT